MNTLSKTIDSLASNLSRHATIYAFDSANGKLLWSSGDQITSWNHGSGMTAVNGKAYINTFDGTFYCFGVAK